MAIRDTGAQRCDWCEEPIRPYSLTELLTLNERPFMVHDHCAAAVLGVFVSSKRPIEIIDLGEQPACSR